MRTLFAPLLVLLLAAAPSAQEWADDAPMPTARTGAASVVLDGRVYVMGGQNTAGEPLAAVEVFEPGAGWSTLAPLRQARVDAAAAVLGGQILVLGGRTADGEPTDSVEVYVAAEDRWAPFGPLSMPREGLGAAVVEGMLFVIGGAGPRGDLLDTAEVLHATWDSFTPPWSLTPARARFGVITLDGALVTLGGFSTAGPLREVVRFDLADESVTPLEPLPFPRGGLAAATDGATLYAVGGRDADDEVRASVLALAPGPGEVWEPLSPLPLPIEAPVAAVLGDSLYVIGGTDGFGSVLAAVRVLPLSPPVGTAAEERPTAGRDALAVVGPNPSRNGTTFELRPADAGDVRLAVFDVLGREVAVLHDGPVPAGALRVSWPARVPAGVYLARLDGPSGGAAVAVTVAR